MYCQYHCVLDVDAVTVYVEHLSIYIKFVLHSVVCSNDQWLKLIVSNCQGRTNLSPDKVPWSAFRTLLSQCIYGGRIDNDFDQRLLNSFVNRLFTVQSFDSTFPLMSNIDGQPGKKINMPEGIRCVGLPPKEAF